MNFGAAVAARVAGTEEARGVGDEERGEEDRWWGAFGRKGRERGEYHQMVPLRDGADGSGEGSGKDRES